MTAGNGPSRAALVVCGNRRVHNCGGTSASDTSMVSITTRPITSVDWRFSSSEAGELECSIANPLSPLLVSGNLDQSHLILQQQDAAHRVIDALYANVPCIDIL